MPLENPRLAWRGDRSVSWPPSGTRPLARPQDLLGPPLAEICEGGAVEAGLALRGARRFVQAWAPVHIDRTLAERLPFVEARRLPDRRRLRRHRSERSPSRSPPGTSPVWCSPARTAAAAARGLGRALASHSDDEARSRAIRAVLRLEELGAELLVVLGRRRDLEDMQCLGRRRAAAFRGHPGVGARGRPTCRVAASPQLKDPQVAAAVLAPKARAARACSNRCSPTSRSIFSSSARRRSRSTATSARSTTVPRTPSSTPCRGPHGAARPFRWCGRSTTAPGLDVGMAVAPRG